MTNGHTNVLLIEDNAGDADLVRLRLLEGGAHLDVRCVDRLSAALASVVTEPPAVVLLDLTLPDSHGPETFRRLHDQAPGVPVVILTAVDDEEMAASTVQQGAQDYLLKGQVDGTSGRRACHCLGQTGASKATEFQPDFNPETGRCPDGKEENACQGKKF